MRTVAILSVCVGAVTAANMYAWLLGSDPRPGDFWRLAAAATASMAVCGAVIAAVRII